MCGILAIIEKAGEALEVRARAAELSKLLRHRGPDDTGLHLIENNGKITALCHERLNIVDPTEGGHQPMIPSNDENIVFIYNGEIYNYLEIRETYKDKFVFKGLSDSEILGPLFEDFGINMVHELEGMWSFFIYDKKTHTYFAARDHVGIIPVYIGVGKNGERYIASELKAIASECVHVEALKPGHYISNEWEQVQWYKPKWHDMEYCPTNKVDLDELRTRLEAAVKAQMCTDAPFGLLLSGGVDSSLTASIAMRIVKQKEIDIGKCGMTEVHSFCVGLKDSPDLVKSRQVAKFIGSTHHEFVYTVDEGLDALPEVVYQLETFNPSTIREGTAMYLMSRKIKALGIKMVLTGEGSDEIFGGYLYFHKAPSAEEFHKELIRKVQDLHKYDLLRSNKACMSFGVEVRPPFLHKAFLEYVLSLDPAEKMPKNNARNIEKYILRKAFDDKENPYLPDEVLWRQKEQFADGVGYSWLDEILKYTDRRVTDEDYINREKIFPVLTPTSKEMFFHRRNFSKFFPGDSVVLTVPFAKSIACSTEAALEWCESFKRNTDESGRSVLGVHNASKQMVTEKTE